MIDNIIITVSMIFIFSFMLFFLYKIYIIYKKFKKYKKYIFIFKDLIMESITDFFTPFTETLILMNNDDDDIGLWFVVFCVTYLYGVYRLITTFWSMYGEVSALREQGVNLRDSHFMCGSGVEKFIENYHKLDDDDDEKDSGKDVNNLSKKKSDK